MTSDYDYRQVKALSGSVLSDLYKSPAIYMHKLENPREETEAMIKGKLAHCMVLEPDKLDEQFLIMEPHIEYRKSTVVGKGNREAMEREAQRTHKSIAKREWVDDAIAMARTLQLDCSISMKMINSNKSLKEYPIYWQEDGVECKGKVDLYDQERNILVDYKTCHNCDPQDKKFRYSVLEFGYLLQLAHYQAGLKERFSLDAYPGVLIIAQEQQAPFMFQIYSISQDDIDQAHEMRSTLLKEYQNLIELNTRPKSCYTDRIIDL